MRPSGTRFVGVTAAGCAVAAALTLGACLSRSAADDSAGGRLRVVATTPVVADFARTIGGDAVSVTQILRPNVDPHDYEPSPADMRDLARADVVVESGAGLESWLGETVASSGFHGTLVDASRGVPLHRTADGTDPHIWHDPRNAMTMCRDIADALIRRDPADAAGIGQRRDAYLGRLTALDRDIRARIDRIPSARRQLVTNHDALGYYVRRYGLHYVGSVIPSFDTSAELSGRDIDRIVARIRQSGAPAIFSESSLPPRIARTIAHEAGVRVVAGTGSIYADSLGPRGSPAATYLSMERHNTDVIARALS